MASIVDLFNPTFLMFLGIMILVVAGLVVYFESKLRDQNHKIASMMSLVSTLAEEVGGVKQYVQLVGGAKPSEPLPLGMSHGHHAVERLIEVSDDEEEDDEEEEDSDEEEAYTDVEELEDIEEDDVNDVKVIQLNVSNELEDEIILDNEDTTPFEFDPVQDLADFEASATLDDDIPNVAEDYVHEVLNLSYEPEGDNQVISDTFVVSENELKSVHVEDDVIDYKKIQLPKLRSIVIEKGLATTSDAGKMKKPELLKLLGVE